MNRDDEYRRQARRKPAGATLRGLMAYAVSIQMRADDPTSGFKVKYRQSDGIATWGEPQIEAFRQHHAIGSRARLALELLLNTVQRRSDVIRMGRQHIRGDAITSPNRRPARSCGFRCSPSCWQRLTLPRAVT